MRWGLYDSGPLESLEKPTTFVLANILWVALAIPVVTIPAATAGLFATFSPWVRGKESEPFGAFFGAIRDHWRKSTLIGLLDVAVGGLVVANLTILRLMDPGQIMALLSLSVTLLVGAAALMANLYVWPLLVVFDLPLRRLLDFSLRLALAYPFHSLALVIGAGVPVLPGLLLYKFILMTVSFSASALLVSWGTWRIIRRHVSAEELAKLEAVK